MERVIYINISTFTSVSSCICMYSVHLSITLYRFLHIRSSRCTIIPMLQPGYPGEVRIPSIYQTPHPILPFFRSLPLSSPSWIKSYLNSKSELKKQEHNRNYKRDNERLLYLNLLFYHGLHSLIIFSCRASARGSSRNSELFAQKGSFILCLA